MGVVEPFAMFTPPALETFYGNYGVGKRRYKTTLFRQNKQGVKYAFWG